VLFVLYPCWNVGKDKKKVFSIFVDWKERKDGIALVNWKRIAKPKVGGGWGLKNIR
jgi:hypothetical protein